MSQVLVEYMHLQYGYLQAKKELEDPERQEIAVNAPGQHGMLSPDNIRALLASMYQNDKDPLKSSMLLSLHRFKHSNLSSEMLTGYIHQVCEAYEEERMRLIQAVSRNVAIFHLDRPERPLLAKDEDYETFARFLEGKKDLEALSTCLPNESEDDSNPVAFWTSAFFHLQDPVLICDVYAHGPRYQALEIFPLQEHPHIAFDITRACTEIVKQSVLKSNEDWKIRYLFPKTFGARTYSRIFFDRIRRYRVLTEPPPPYAERDSVALFKAEAGVVEHFSKTEKEEEKSFEDPLRKKIWDLLHDEELDQTLDELKQLILKMQSTFDVEFCILSFRNQVYAFAKKCYEAKDNLKLEGHPQASTKKMCCVSADDSAQLYELFLLRLNDAEVFARLKALEEWEPPEGCLEHSMEYYRVTLVGTAFHVVDTLKAQAEGWSRNFERQPSGKAPEIFKERLSKLHRSPSMSKPHRFCSNLGLPF